MEQSLAIGGFGISSSSLSRHFMEETEEKLKVFTTRKLQDDYVALFIDGKTFAKQQIIIALGVTIDGDKIPVNKYKSIHVNESLSVQMSRVFINKSKFQGHSELNKNLILYH